MVTGKIRDGYRVIKSRKGNKLIRNENEAERMKEGRGKTGKI